MHAADPPTADRLAAWAASLTWDAAPAAAVREAKRCLLDVVGCALAGTRHPVSAHVRRHAADVLSGGACSTVFGFSAGPLAAAQINATAAHVWDFDDTCFEGIVHASAIVWPAVQAATEFAGGSGAMLLSAFMAGVEVELAVARGVGPGLYQRGWWNTSVLGVVGAAAGAGRALDLAPDKLSHAIRLAAAFASGTRVVLGTPAKPFGAGLAARDGLEAALAARVGIAGPDRVFEAHRGFAAVLSGSPFDTALAAAGGRWGLVAPGTAFKLYPACSAVQAAVEAVLWLRARHDLSPTNVAHVRCEVTRLVAMSLTYDRPTTPQEAQFSLPFAVACALIHGNFEIAHLDETMVHAPEVSALMARVEMVETDDLSSTPADEIDCPEAARVTVTTRDGRHLQHTVLAATGMPKNRAADGRLAEKFRRNAAIAGWSENASADLARTITSIEARGNARLLSLLESEPSEPWKA